MGPVDLSAHNFKSAVLGNCHPRWEGLLVIQLLSDIPAPSN